MPDEGRIPMMFQYNLVYTFNDGFVADEAVMARSYPEAVRQLRAAHDEEIVRVELASKLSADGELIDEI